MLPSSAFLLVIVLIVGAAGLPLVPPQSQPASAKLDAGITQVRSGDFFGALVTLNEVVTDVSVRPDLATVLARARAYQALAYALLDQPERTREFVSLALAADPNVATDAPEFTPAVAALFNELRRRPATTQSPEAVGDGAVQAGATQEAFLAYLRAFQALPEPMPPADDQRLREKIVRVVQKMITKPVVSDAARTHFSKAQDLLDAEAILGGAVGSASQQAAVELRQAVRLAPWWGDAAFRLATVQQRLSRVDEALVNLGIYRLADPTGFAARAERAAPRDATAASPAAVAPPVVAKPAGPALIYIYWPKQQRSSGKHEVFCNGQLVAEMQNNRYVVLKAAAGTHDLAFLKKHETVVVEGGREYYFRASIEGHWKFALGEQLRPTVTDAAKAEMLDKGTSLNAAKYTRSAECSVAAPATGGRRR